MIAALLTQFKFNNQNSVAAMEYSKTFTGTLTAPDGTVRHFINGALAREGDLPAVEYPDGSVVYYIENPKRGVFGQRLSVEHRTNGPALIRSDGDQMYYQFGKLHRNPDEGPAVILQSGVKKWFKSGECVRVEPPQSPLPSPSTHPVSTPAAMNTNTTPKARAEALQVHLCRLAHAYYVLDAPLASDSEYDALFRELEALEAQYPDLVISESPTQRVGGAPLKSFESVRHTTAMLSLANAMDEQEAQRFAANCAASLGLDIEEVVYGLEDKYDGIAITLKYVDGLLIQAATRGDGESGENVTEQARTVKSIPLRLTEPVSLEVRGEMMMLDRDFERVNAELVEAGKKPLVNPRNGAAGAVRQLDPKITASRRLTFFAYGLNAADEHAFEDQMDVLDYLKTLGFRVSPNVQRVVGFEGMKNGFAEMAAKRKSLGWGIDGVVFKVLNLQDQEKIGWNSRTPKFAIAWKFPPEEMPTLLQGIDVQVGRTGALTPVARLRLVFVGGVTVSNVTLHNAGQIKAKQIRVGDTVIVRRAGDVIPEIVGPIMELRPEGTVEWEMPSFCPACGSPVHQIGAEHYCSGGSTCPEQRLHRIAHFSSRLAMDIEGLGETKVATLLAEGFITKASDLFSLDADRLAHIPGFGDQSVSKLVAAIAGTRNRPLHKMIFALGIEGVGEKSAKDLANAFGTWERFSSATKQELLSVGDVGEITSDSILDFLASPETSVEARRLANFIAPMPVERIYGGVFEGKSLVLTGTFPSLSREAATNLIESAGGKVAGSVSKKTFALVAGDSAGSKLDKAKSLNIQVWDEAWLLAQVGEQRVASTEAAGYKATPESTSESSDQPASTLQSSLF